MTSPASATPTVADQPARDRIRNDLHHTLFVEAGAGSGKTTALVDRVVALVTSGTAELARIAAITFTEKAGAELRDRIRQVLQRTADDPATPAAASQRCRTALDQLDGAAIGTLHAFAQRILTEHPVEAELPPRLEVLDEVSSGIEFDRRWARTLDRLLEDPALERTLLLLATANVRPTGLRALARAFDGSWDLVVDRVPDAAPPPPTVEQSLPGLLQEVERLREWGQRCLNSSDHLMVEIDEILAWAQRVRDHLGDELEVIELLGDRRPRFSGSRGRKEHWDGGCKSEVQDAIKAARRLVEEARLNVLQACARHLGSAMRAHTLAAAEERRASGRLEFHDLLVLARQVIRHPEHGAAVRRSLQERYQRLLLDEFQDTDPIQIDLAVRIAALDPDAAGEGDWTAVEVAPGRLFMVGDPKQSIYRFRRADIAVFLTAKERFGERADGLVELTSSFRTVSPIIDWVNTTFGTLLGEEPDHDIDVPSQPAYVGLDPQRGAPPEGPAVAVVGSVLHPKGTRAEPMRAAEARDVAHAVVTAVQEGWSVRTGAGWRPASLGDITILVPARTSLPYLEDALEAAGVPFRTESSSLVYATRAVRDLMMVLRAADDPTDHLSVVSALRTPLLACGDDDLLRYRLDHGPRWSYTAPEPPDPALGPVQAGLAYLRELHEARHWSSPAELLDRIARDGRALELGFAEGRPRDVWRRLRFVIDQARAWSEATGGTLRSYLGWVQQQTSDGARVTEAVLPEADDDAVRIMTIHAAKGLEFPITIVSGMSTGAQGNRSSVDVYFPHDGGPVGYRLGAEVVTEEWESGKPIDEQMGYDERVRLLYVATTRAKDHLVVSLHRRERPPPDKRGNRTSAEILVAGMGAALDHLPDLSGSAQPLSADPAATPEPPPPFEAWDAARTDALRRAARPGAVAATALTDEGGPDAGLDAAFGPEGARQLFAEPATQPSLFDLPAGSGGGPGSTGRPGPTGPDGEPAVSEPDPGLQKRPRDLDLPPWLKGRYGTAVGRAVHGVLQVVDLATADGLHAAVAAQCQAEAVPERAEEVRQLVEMALAAPVVRAASTSVHWREVYACTPIGDRLLEGYVDLLYRGPDGLVVVDHKTSSSADPEELDLRVAGYRLQGAAYAVAVSRSAGEPVSRVVFLFLTPVGPVERELPDLPAAMDHVERLVRAGQELVTV
ncbi:MAG: UvrD-helicase domain-containing protein [Acidimicrobiia bacterium]